MAAGEVIRASDNVSGDWTQRWQGVSAAAHDAYVTVRENPGTTVLVAAGVVALTVASPVVATVMGTVGAGMALYSGTKIAWNETHAAMAATRGDAAARADYLRRSGREAFNVGMWGVGSAAGRSVAAVARLRGSVATEAAVDATKKTSVLPAPVTSPPPTPAVTVAPPPPAAAVPVITAPATAESTRSIRESAQYFEALRHRVDALRADANVPDGLFGLQRELSNVRATYSPASGMSFDTYLDTRLRAAVDIERRYWDAMRAVSSASWDGPRAEMPLMLRFARQTELHRRNVDTGLARLTGAGRGFQTPHDVVELRPIDEIIELSRQQGAPGWLRNIADRARSDGVRTYDVGKPDPYIMAGLSQPGPADVWAIRMHRLAPHHADTPMSWEGAIDYVNALRMPRFYGLPTPRPFSDIWQIANADLLANRNGMVASNLPKIQEAMRVHLALEREGQIVPYFRRLPNEVLPDFMRGSP